MSLPGFEQADKFADSYDETVREHGWNSPQIIFELVEQHLTPGENLLDLGIGTGLSAAPFTDAGIRVFGVDGSGKMLDCCRAKGVAVDLKQHDIRSVPLPYEDHSFDHVIACGVFHLIGHLDGIFAEAARLMRGRGTFAFTIEPLHDEVSSGGNLIEDGVLETTNEKSGIVSYRHSVALVEDLLRYAGFFAERVKEYVAYAKTDWADERSFRACVAREKASSLRLP
jgi:predicted TPR repeat methyltransferase